MTDIILETEEMMRQERMAKLWKENGKTLIVFIVMTVIATGVISAWRTWDAGVKAKGTDQILTLLEDKNFPDNIKDAKLDMRPGLRGIALINGAQTYLDQKKTAEAIALYAKAADDNAVPGEIRDLAVMMQARLTKDAQNDEALMKKLDAVTKTSNSPWRAHAALEAAALQAEKKDIPAARKYLAGIMEQKNAPDALYKKAQALDHIYATREKTAPIDKNKKEGT
ncbi:MAG: hypothetical protein WBK77_00165 [Alphaproteobacteria bacterium]